MKKHKNFLLHRNVDYVDINSEHGIVIRFTDESHTYLPPFFLRGILRYCFENLDEINDFLNEEE